MQICVNLVFTRFYFGKYTIYCLTHLIYYDYTVMHK